jgi:murein DD-endopeptidase MepM/ murein hydrolase activator NlpD
MLNLKTYFLIGFLAAVILSQTGCITVTQGPPRIDFRYNDHYSTGEQHRALDLATGYGDRVYAIAAGEVLVAVEGRREPWIIVKHEGSVTVRYYHIANLKVSRGDRVQQGQQLALVGLTGRALPRRDDTRPTRPHLHMEAFQDSVEIDPENLGMTCPDQGGRYWWPVACGR